MRADVVMLSFIAGTAAMTKVGVGFHAVVVMPVNECSENSIFGATT